MSLKVDCLVVVGGDGTLHEAIEGLLSVNQSRQLPVAYVPAGTGNDFARGYGISTVPQCALQQIMNNDRRHLINVSRFDDQIAGHSGIFINNFGVGFDAAIVHATNHSRAKAFLNHHHLGSFAYIAHAIKVLFTQPVFQVQVNRPEGHECFKHAFLLIASNHPFIGGGIKVAPDQRVDQQQLELIVLEKGHQLTLIWSIILFALGKLPSSGHAHVFRGSTLSYQFQPAQYCQVDGEELPPAARQLVLSCCTYPVWQQPSK